VVLSVERIGVPPGVVFAVCKITTGD